MYQVKIWMFEKKKKKKKKKILKYINDNFYIHDT